MSSAPKNRSKIVFFINDKRFEIADQRCFQTLAEFLRYEAHLAGTKIVCAEGDCGACTALLGSFHEIKNGRLTYKSVNTCIIPLFSLDATHLITVEGLKSGSELHPVQQAMVDHFGAQCGYCTPGIVVAMAAMTENALLKKKNKITEKTARNYLTGNLCRCTGYQPILKAAESIDLSKMTSLRDRYHSDDRMTEMAELITKPVEIKTNEFELFIPTTVPQALKIKNESPAVRMIAGSTDTGVINNKGKDAYKAVLSLAHVASMYEIKKENSTLVIGARVTLAQLQDTIEKEIPELGEMLHVFASPQIKNQATLMGNLMNASPIGDTIPFLMINGAEVELQNQTQTRRVPIEKFFLGYKKLDLQKDEIATHIRIQIPSKNTFVKLYKVARRKDLDISAVTFAAEVETDGKNIKRARVALGGVGPTVLRMYDIEKNWTGAEIKKTLFEDSGQLLPTLIKPLSDVRGTGDFRLTLCQNLLMKFHQELAAELKI